MPRLTLTVSLLLCLTLNGSALAMSRLTSSMTPEADEVSATLDAFHGAAASADGEAYFSLFAPNGVFIGTDKSERWPVETFKEYALPIFASGRGWTYVMTERHIDFSPDGQTAWFDELLNNEGYGTSRGSGVLIRTGGDWKITQYHLTFPMPNDLAADFTRTIKEWEKAQK